MREVYVYEESKDKQWEIIQSVWSIINQYKYPHYLFEDGYLLIRYEQEAEKELKKALKKYKTEYHNDWNEWSLEIRRNKEEFTHLFWAISNMAINNKDKSDFKAEKAWDRISHCAYNMFTKILKDSDGDQIWESTLYFWAGKKWLFNEGYVAGKLGLMDK